MPNSIKTYFLPPYSLQKTSSGKGETNSPSSGSAKSFKNVPLKLFTGHSTSELPTGPSHLELSTGVLHKDYIKSLMTKASKDLTSSDEISDGASNSNKASSDAYGRLAGKNILAHINKLCQDNEIKYKMEALQRVEKAFGSKVFAPILLSKMIDILKNARLTINFDASKFDFKRFLENGEYKNCHSFGYRFGDHPNYIIGRNSIETKVFQLEELKGMPYADYSSTNRYMAGLSAFGSKKENFSPFSRPIYAALDFMNGTNGGAKHYGKSFFELNDNMKLICTFSPFDTYGNRFAWNKSKLSTFYHLENLIANCQEDFYGYNCFQSLLEMASGKSVKPHSKYGKGTEGNYIEAHVHGNVLLSRDVKRIYICRKELGPRENEAKLYAEEIKNYFAQDKKFIIIY